MTAHIGEHRLLRYALDELDGAERLAIDAHLEQCAGCRDRATAERRLDEWIVASAASAPPGSAERALQGMWRSVDQVADEGGGPASPARRPALLSPALLVPLAALLAVVAVVLWRGSGRPAPVGPPHLPDAAPALPDPSMLDELDELDVLGSVDEPGRVASPTDPAQAVDLARLAGIRRDLAAALVAADAEFPFLSPAFRDACEEHMQTLRREGWPVSSLVRGLALADDEVGAAAALRYAAGDAATYGILAAALDLPERVPVVVDLVDREAVRVEDSAVLVRVLGRVAAAALDDEGLASDALRLLSRAEGPRCRAAVERLAERAWTRAARSRGRRDLPTTSEAEFLWVAARLPAAVALPRLVEAARRPRLRAECARLFATLAGGSAELAAAAITEVLADDELRPVVLSWARALDLHGTDVALLRYLEQASFDGDVLDTLVSFGGPTVAAELFVLWADRRPAAQVPELLGALNRLLAAEPRLAEVLGASVQGGRVEDLVALAQQLPAELRGELLLGCLGAWPADKTDDREGYRATVVAALGRLGNEADGQRLLTWIAGRPSADPVLPLAWAVAGRLAAVAASAAWERAGADPRILADVSASTARRLHVAARPSTGMLSPLRAALGRLPRSPSASTEDLP